MLNLGFRNFRPIFLKSVLFLIATLFLYYGYVFEFIFALLTFGDKGVRVLAGANLRSKILWYAQNFLSSKFHFSLWKIYFFQFINKLLKFE